MSNIPLPGQIYKHFKGNLYRVITLAEHSETGEKLVVYQALYGDYQVYARSLSMFMEQVDKEKYPNAAARYRFELQKELIEAPVQEAVEGKISKAPAQEVPESNLDPLVLEFLDADTCEKRLNILSALHERITDDMINIMAISAGVEIEEGDTERRFEELRACLTTLGRYESSRLR